jgi:hypothetical protein
MLLGMTSGLRLHRKEAAWDGDQLKGLFGIAPL